MIKAIFVLAACLFSALASAQTVRFERFVPALQQPWYFADGIDGIVSLNDSIYAVSQGNAYVMSRTGRVVTLSAPPLAQLAEGLVYRDGSFYLPTLGGVIRTDENFAFQEMIAGGEPGKPGAIVRGHDMDLRGDGGFVVLDVDFTVPDGSATRVKFYDADFNFEYEFGGLASCASGFAQPPAGLLAAPDGTFYVTDTCNHQIEQFTATGALLRQFGIPAEILSPQDVVLSHDKTQFLVPGSGGVSVFSVKTGGFIQQFAPPPDGSSFFLSVAADPDGTYLVGSISAIHRFSGDFNLMSTFQGASTEEGFFNQNVDIAVDNLNDLVLVPEFRNNRVSVLDGQGQFVRFFDATTANFETLDTPSSLANYGPASVNGPNIFALADCNGVKFFSTNGTTFAPLTTVAGSGVGEFESRCNKVVGNININETYLTDFATNRVLVFSNASYNFVREWVSINPATDNPMQIRSLTTDGTSLIALGDNTRVVYYDRDGNPEKDFSIGFGNDVTYTQVGDLLVTGINGISRYDVDGNLIQTTPLGAGVGPGQIRASFNVHAVDLGVDQIVVSDGLNNRVQYFRSLVTTENPKAIIVAGGGPYPGNALWNATRVNANFGYRTLLNQGFGKDAIQYISDDSADLDQNGAEDDIDAAATRANVQAAITGSFSDDATELVIYLVDHGGDDTFRLSGSQTIGSAELNTWLDTWQAAHPGQRITIIYDACQAGSFVDDISAGSSGRLVIASARADQSAYFVSQGALSFSNQFWTQIFNGETLKDAFNAATTVIEDAFPTQNPILDTNGNGIGNEAADFAVLDLIGGGFIGNGVPILGSRPTVDSVSPPTTIMDGNQATLEAFGVTDADGIARVWATLVPPGYVPGSADNPVSDLPTVELMQVGSSDNYSAMHDGFSEIGSYQVVIYAEDDFGNVSVPLLTSVDINSPLRRRAVIIAGGDLADPEFPAISANAQLAFAAISQQGYGADGVTCVNPFCDAVQYLTPEAVAGFDATATLTNVQDAIATWGATETQDLTVYLVAPRQGTGYRLAGGQILTASALDSYLDIAETSNPGRITVLVEGDLAGDFVNQLSPADNRRFLIASASATDVAADALGGVLSFSRFFWSQTLNGATVFNAFQQARRGIRFADECQNPEFDADGNNIPNQLLDGAFAGTYRIGSGILLAGDDPLVNAVDAPDVVIEGSAFNLTVSGITTTGTIDSVVAVISSSSGCETTQPLSDMGGGTWAGELAAVTAQSPRLTVAAFAIDDEGNVSLPVVREVAGDVLLRAGFEDD